MWLLYIFRRTLLGAWRLFIGLIIGVIIYVWNFWYHKDSWQAIHDSVADFVRGLLSTSWFSELVQWNTLLHLDDKVVFALYILGGRLLWMLLEAVFFTFPYWVFRGRHEDAELEQAREQLRQQKEAELRETEAGMAALKQQLTLGGGKDAAPSRRPHSLISALGDAASIQKSDAPH